uniref:Si:ch211-1o7.3 n=1 Tax=Oryzias latipes TaxID=8090 RepID=A0A3P9H5U8_ORYLA
MWVQDENNTDADGNDLLSPTSSDGETDLSSDDGGDIECKILEKQRNVAYQKLSELEEVSNQLLKEINVLEIQFQTERCCRENAESLAVKVSNENKVLKRRSMMPLISELPENLFDLSLDAEDHLICGDVVDLGHEDNNEENLLLESQAKITALQASVDGLLAEKLQLEQQVEYLTTEQNHLREQLALEIAEKEALLRKINKQNKTINKIKRVSQMVTEEFTEMSQKLELEQDLRQQAEVVAHQMLVEKTECHGQNMVEMDGKDSGIQLQLQEALEQISHINTTLSDIHCYYQSQGKERMDAMEESRILSELRNKLEMSEREKKTLETQLFEANKCVAQLQTEVKQIQETQSFGAITKELSAPPPPPLPPPPPPPPPLSTPAIDFQDFLRSRRKDGVSKTEQNNSTPLLNMKAKAVDEMMERIKKGIVLRPVMKIQEEDTCWKDQKSQNRKSAILELKGMLDNMKRRDSSKRGISRRVEDSELLLVLQRRRRVMAGNSEQSSTLQGHSLCRTAIVHHQKFTSELWGTLGAEQMPIQERLASQQQVMVPGHLSSAMPQCFGG